MEADQKLKKDAGKLRYDLTPVEIEEKLARIFTFGIEKGYGEESWKKVEEKRYIAALRRHFAEYLKDPQSKDAESGELHIAHAMWNAGTLMWKAMQDEEREKKSVNISYSYAANRC